MSHQPNDFESAAAQGRRGFAGEFLGLLRRTGKWWLLPIVLAILVVGGLVILGGSAAAPFIYTLF